jgi:hypothetical protein
VWRREPIGEDDPAMDEHHKSVKAAIADSNTVIMAQKNVVVVG